mmetsp:Transcript_22072/g.67797  ORF Transcript_22072/g.67797 Transcript_22072/m.67797 type:complete len:243 (+) Transcript_22072:530-1258(+)
MRQCLHARVKDDGNAHVLHLPQKARREPWVRRLHVARQQRSAAVHHRHRLVRVRRLDLAGHLDANGSAAYDGHGPGFGDLVPRRVEHGVVLRRGLALGLQRKVESAAAGGHDDVVRRDLLAARELHLARRDRLRRALDDAAALQETVVWDTHLLLVGGAAEGGGAQRRHGVREGILALNEHHVGLTVQRVRRHGARVAAADDGDGLVGARASPHCKLGFEIRVLGLGSGWVSCGGCCGCGWG